MDRRRTLFMRGVTWDEAPSVDALTEHFTCYGQVDNVSVSWTKARPDTWIAKISFCTGDGARLTFENRFRPDIPCFEGIFIYIDWYRPIWLTDPVKNKGKERGFIPKSSFAQPKSDIPDGNRKWTFPDVVQVAQKRKRCKAARRSKEIRAFTLWDPSDFKDDRKKRKRKHTKKEKTERHQHVKGHKKVKEVLRAGGYGCKIAAADINFGEVIGEGGRATVFGGTLQAGSQSIPVALKKYRMGRMTPRERKQIESEAEFLSTLNHPNIIKYYGTCLEQKTIVMEKMGLTLNTATKRK